MDTIIQAHGLHRIYRTGEEEVHAVNDVSLDVETGTLTAIIGRSGAGKTTLLNLLSALDTPDAGEVLIEGQSLYELSEGERLALRREKIGFVFQNFGLLPLLSAAENVSVPLRMRHMDRKKRETRIQEALDWVGLGKRAKHRPYELSGGERQRVAIARALVTRPHIILADEPTGQLDSTTGARILDVLKRLTTEYGITLLVVTHDQLVVEAAETVYRMRDGVLTPAENLIRLGV